MMKNQPDPEMKCIIGCWLWMLPFGQKIPLPLSPEFISRPFCLCVSLGLSSPFCFPSVHILFSVPLSALIPFFTFVAPSPSWPLPLSEYERLKFYWCFVKQCYRQVWLLNISCQIWTNKCHYLDHITEPAPTILEIHEYAKDNINVYLLVFWHQGDLILGEIGVIVSSATLNWKIKLFIRDYTITIKARLNPS